MSKQPAYLSPYHEALDEHGASFEATLWATQRTQRVRFEVFTQMCFLAGKRVLDAGCGRGDFAAYLLDQNIEYDRFIGIDGMAAMVESADRRGLSRAVFEAGDFVQQTELLTIGDPQVIVFSGSLNTMDMPTVFAVLNAAWKASGQTLMFNFLSDRCDDAAPAQTGPAFRHDTMALLDWALSNTQQVALRQDYFPFGHDATIRMDKT